jgi:hypothetical protein
MHAAVYENIRGILYKHAALGVPEYSTLHNLTNGIVSVLVRGGSVLGVH